MLGKTHLSWQKWREQYLVSRERKFIYHHKTILLYYLVLKQMYINSLYIKSLYFILHTVSTFVHLIIFIKTKDMCI